jgi:hypothetical protein
MEDNQNNKIEMLIVDGIIRFEASIVALVMAISRWFSGESKQRQVTEVVCDESDKVYKP